MDQENKINIPKLISKAEICSDVIKTVSTKIIDSDKKTLQNLSKINFIIGAEHQKRFFLFFKLFEYNKLIKKELSLIKNITKNFNWKYHLVNSILYLNLAVFLNKKLFEASYNLGIIYKRIDEKKFAIKSFESIIGLFNPKKNILEKIKDFFDFNNYDDSILEEIMWHKELIDRNIFKANTFWNLATLENNIKKKKKLYDEARSFLNTFGPYEINYMNFLKKNNFYKEYFDNIKNVLEYSHLEPIEFSNLKTKDNIFFPWTNKVDLNISFDHILRIQSIYKYSIENYEVIEEKKLGDDIFYNYGLYFKSSKKNLTTTDLINTILEVYIDPNLINKKY